MRPKYDKEEQNLGLRVTKQQNSGSVRSRAAIWRQGLILTFPT